MRNSALRLETALISSLYRWPGSLPKPRKQDTSLPNLYRILTAAYELLKEIRENENVDEMKESGEASVFGLGL